MKIPFIRLPLLLLSLLATREVRGEFNPALVAADSRWVVYVDFNALRQSAIGKQLVAAANQLKVPVGDTSIHVDVPKVLATVGSVTAYGSNFRSKDPEMITGSLVIQGTPELRKIAEALLIQANLAKPDQVAEVKDLGFAAYEISAPDGKPGPHLMIAFPPEPIVLVSKSKEQLLLGRELFRGHGQSLAQNSSAPLNALLANSGHATLFAASVVPSEQFFPENTPQARILQMASSGSVALGEESTKTFAHVQLLANSGEMADKLQKILQGMAAMMSLGESSDQELNEFLNSAVVDRQDKTVSLQLSYSSERLAQLIQRMTETSIARRGGGPDRPYAIGKVVATWTAAAPTTDSGAAPETALHTVQDVALVNGSAITFEVVGDGPTGGSNFDRVRVIPKGDAAGASSGLIFSRKLMTEPRRPIVRNNNGEMHRHSYYQFYFPGESGTYTLEVRMTPPSHGDTTLSVGVKNPTVPGDATAEPAHDGASDSNGRP